MKNSTALEVDSLRKICIHINSNINLKAHWLFKSKNYTWFISFRIFKRAEPTTPHRTTVATVPKMSFFLLHKINQFNLWRKQYEKDRVETAQCSTIRTFSLINSMAVVLKILKQWYSSMVNNYSLPSQLGKKYFLFIKRWNVCTCSLICTLYHLSNADHKHCTKSSMRISC